MASGEYDRPPRMYMGAKQDPIGTFLRPWKKFTRGKVCTSLAKGKNARNDLLELMYEYIDQSVLIEIYPLLPEEPSIQDVERVLIEHFGAATYLFGPGYTVDLHAKATSMNDHTERAAWRRAVMLTELAEFAVGRVIYTTETELNPQGRGKKALMNAPMKYSMLEASASGMTPLQIYEANRQIQARTAQSTTKQVTRSRPKTPLWIAGAMQGRPAQLCCIATDGTEYYATEELSPLVAQRMQAAEKVLVDLKRKEEKEDAAASRKRHQEREKRKQKEREREEREARRTRDREHTREQGETEDLRSTITSRTNSRNASRNSSRTRSRSPRTEERKRSPPRFRTSRLKPESNTGYRAEQYQRERQWDEAELAKDRLFAADDPAPDLEMLRVFMEEVKAAPVTLRPMGGPWRWNGDEWEVRGSEHVVDTQHREIDYRDDFIFSAAGRWRPKSRFKQNYIFMDHLQIWFPIVRMYNIDGKCLPRYGDHRGTTKLRHPQNQWGYGDDDFNRQLPLYTNLEGNTTIAEHAIPWSAIDENLRQDAARGGNFAAQAMLHAVTKNTNLRDALTSIYNIDTAPLVKALGELQAAGRTFINAAFPVANRTILLDAYELFGPGRAAAHAANLAFAYKGEQTPNYGDRDRGRTPDRGRSFSRDRDRRSFSRDPSRYSRAGSRPPREDRYDRNNRGRSHSPGFRATTCQRCLLRHSGTTCPECHICRKTGHYQNACPQAQRTITNSDSSQQRAVAAAATTSREEQGHKPGGARAGMTAAVATTTDNQTPEESVLQAYFPR